MIIPNNGKVVIIDDQMDQVKELIMALSKNNIPFSYFRDENGDDLPEDGNHLKNIRLIFLDIVLDTGTDQSEKSVISNALSRLNRIIGENNGPYFIFLWSTRYEKYGKKLIEEITTKPLFKNRQPIAFIELNKKELREKGFLAIVSALDKEIQKFDSLNAFLYWESIINDSAGEITNELISLINSDNWNNDTKNILYRLSSAYWGLSIKDIGPKEQKRKVLGAYSTLNQVLSDKIEANSHNNYDPLLDNLLENKGENNTELFAKINEKIHVDSKPQKDVSIPGSVLFCIDLLNEDVDKIDAELERSILKLDALKGKNGINIEEIVVKKKLAFSNKKETLERIIKEKRRNLNSIINDSLKDAKEILSQQKEEIIKNGIYVELNISPRCDFAQNKIKNHRFLPGVLVPEEYREKFNKYAEYNYISDFKIHMESNLYFFLFDFRHFYSLRILPENLSPKFRIKENLLNELQVKLSGHINRLGLLYME